VPPDQFLQLALLHHQAGRYSEAEKLYRQILTQFPSHPHALHLLGMLLAQTAREQDGIEYIHQSIVAHPNVAQYHSNLGEIYRRMGKFNEAIAALNRAVQLDPRFADAQNNLSGALGDVGRFDEAIAAAHKAIALQPDFGEAYYNLGNALKSAGQPGAAIVAFRHAIQLKPDFLDAHLNLGTALQESGQFDEAVAAFSQAVRIKPDFAQAHSNLGLSLDSCGRAEEAIAAFRNAIRINSGDSRSHCNLAVTLARKGLVDQALEECSHAIRLAPESGEVHCTLGNILKDMGQIEQALAAYRRAVDLSPGDSAIHSNLLFALNLSLDCTPEQLSADHLRWAARHVHPLKPLIRPHENDPDPHRRLRIGYVSPDFCGHPVGRFLLPLLANHDHDQFQIVCYSAVPMPDGYTPRFQRHADVWRDIRALSNDEAADLVRTDRIDILIDLAMHTANNRILLFARKPAPVQAAYLAYAGTTGLDTIDFRISDPYLDPAELPREHYTEQTITLAETFWCYDPLIENLAPGSLPAASSGHVVFGCLNNFCKSSPAALTAWARILAAVPESRFQLHVLPGSTRQRVARFFCDQGIDPLRIEFIDRLSPADYMRQYRRIDIALDPFPYVGGTTTCDALWIGAPVITLGGQNAVSRGGVSILRNIGLPELIAADPDQYVRIAADLAGDLPRLTELRSSLRQRMLASPLMNAPRFARNMEDVLRRMWLRWCSKRPNQ
jgi:protein O-GlcNAc transferase